ncbi:hypothetical protein AOLI_G00247570 [Acnodon oligacanthus]
MSLISASGSISALFKRRLGQCRSDSLYTERSTALRSSHDSCSGFSNDHLKGAPASQQQVTEKANGGEDAQRSYQQQHRAAQDSPGSRVPQSAARLQAGESRHPEDDTQLPPFPTNSTSVSQGFSRCVHEVLHFLSKDEMKAQSQRKPIKPSVFKRREMEGKRSPSAELHRP